MFLHTKVNFSYWIDALIVTNICAFEHGHCTNAQRRDVRVFLFLRFFLHDGQPYDLLDSFHRIKFIALGFICKNMNTIIIRKMVGAIFNDFFY